MTKQVYEAPKMESLGSFEQLTQSVVSGSSLDDNSFSGAVVGVDAVLS